MLTTVELLDIARHRQGDVSDYRIAQLLDLTPSHISSYRRKGVTPSNPVAMRLGELAGVDPLEAAVSANLERSTSEEDREFWSLLLARLRPAPKRKRAS